MEFNMFWYPIIILVLASIFYGIDYAIKETKAQNEEERKAREFLEIHNNIDNLCKTNKLNSEERTQLINALLENYEEEFFDSFNFMSKNNNIVYSSQEQYNAAYDKAFENAKKVYKENLINNSDEGLLKTSFYKFKDIGKFGGDPDNLFWTPVLEKIFGKYLKCLSIDMYNNSFGYNVE